LSFPLHPLGLVPSLATCHQLRWVAPTYISIYNVLSNPVYAGVYVYGKVGRKINLSHLIVYLS
jgi:hypothetical protein